MRIDIMKGIQLNIANELSLVQEAQEDLLNLIASGPQQDLVEDMTKLNVALMVGLGGNVDETA
ncbi:MAG: hypothetical protein QME40_01295 [bacterium]|nr:hypothetical protein [bacterium]